MGIIKGCLFFKCKMGHMFHPHKNEKNPLANTMACPAYRCRPLICDKKSFLK